MKKFKTSQLSLLLIAIFCCSLFQSCIVEYKEDKGAAIDERKALIEERLKPMADFEKLDVSINRKVLKIDAELKKSDERLYFISSSYLLVAYDIGSVDGVWESITANVSMPGREDYNRTFTKSDFDEFGFYITQSMTNLDHLEDAVDENIFSLIKNDDYQNRESLASDLKTFFSNTGEIQNVIIIGIGFKEDYSFVHLQTIGEHSDVLSFLYNRKTNELLGISINDFDDMP